MLENDKYKRNSNIELLRIIAMLFIVGGHYIAQGHVIDKLNNNNINYILLQFLGNGSRIAVNLFLIIAAWFMVDSKFKAEKLLKIWGIVFFWGILMTLISSFWKDIQLKRLLQCCIPILGRPVWFASAYMILLMMSPFLQIILNWGQKKLKVFISLIFISAGLVPTITNFTDSFTESVYWFIFVFLLIGYIKLYIDIKKMNKLIFLVGIILYILLVAFRILGDLCDNYFILIISKVAGQYLSDFKSVPNFICALCIFFGVLNINIGGNNIINWLASGSFAVYVVHQTQAFYPILWNEILNVEEILISPYIVVIFCLQIVVLYFIVNCMDIIRKITIERIWVHSIIYLKTCDFIDKIYEKICINK